MKPRIFVNMHYMALGGAERALLGLLNALDPERVEVDLFLNQHTGEFMPLIPEHVHLLPEQRGYNAIERPMHDISREGQWRVLLERLRARWQHRRYLKTLTPEQRAYDASIFQYVADCVTPVLPPIRLDTDFRGHADLADFADRSISQNEKGGHTDSEGLNNQPVLQNQHEAKSANHPRDLREIKYDLAISFLTPHNIVLDKVKARKKIAWIHTDYSTIHVNVEKELRVWSRYDYIASISDDCTRSFLQKFPSLKDKIILIENILSPTLVRQQASSNAQFGTAHDHDASDRDEQTLPLPPPFCVREGEGEPIVLLSVGRFCHQKNFDNVPDIARRVIENGLDIRWYLIGFGDEALIRRMIAEAGMEDHVIILGKKNNPYPYIKACDIYVQPSRYEGKSVTVREAQILCKPVIITDYSTARSQVQDGVNGVICPMDNAGIARAICDLAGDAARRQALADYLATHDYGNEREVDKIYDIIQRAQSKKSSVAGM